MNTMFLILVIALVMVTVAGKTTETSHAADLTAAQPANQYPPEYPGIRGKTKRNIAQAQADIAIKQFYRVYERWPNNWQEVKDSLIFQSDLIGRQMQVIDPDDGNVDFKWDVVYEGGSSPRIHTLLGDGKVKTYVLQRPDTYREWLPNVQKQHPTFDANYYLSDKKRLAMVSIMVQLQAYSFTEYFDHHKEWPKSVSAVLAEGYSPIKAGSTNPLTGKPFKFDGSANDILVRNSGQLLTLVPMDHQGNQPPIYISF
jgi:hypothetical protein